MKRDSHIGNPWELLPAGVDPADRMPLWFHDLYTDGIHPDARFPRDRYVRLAERFKRGEAGGLVRLETSPAADRADLLVAHDRDYVDRFLDGQMDAKETRRIGLRPWTPLLIPRTLRIMGGAIAALQHVARTGGLAGNMAGGTHHAHRDFGSGYCVFNDLAVCALLAVKEFGFRRVAILDLDVHQGDGTATILADEPTALTISVHCAENFPFRKAVSDHDLAVPAGTEDAAYLATVRSAVETAVAFQPDLLLYQGGVDGLASDALGRLSLTRAGMRQRNRMVFEAVLDLGIPCIVYMGGGYSNPIGPTVDAFHDLFLDAAWANRHALAGRRLLGGGTPLPRQSPSLVQS